MLKTSHYIDNQGWCFSCLHFAISLLLRGARFWLEGASYLNIHPLHWPPSLMKPARVESYHRLKLCAACIYACTFPLFVTKDGGQSKGSISPNNEMSKGGDSNPYFPFLYCIPMPNVNAYCLLVINLSSRGSEVNYVLDSFYVYLVVKTWNPVEWNRGNLWNRLAPHLLLLVVLQ